MFSASIDSAEVIALLDRVSYSAQFVTREVARGTAERIVQEAKARVRRATGETASEIHLELTHDETGYVVLGYDTRINKTFVEDYLESGTKFQYARPFFFSSALLEEGPYMRRLVDRLTEWLENSGR